jgi:2-polyprenyl-3-methyl-5-hydroxy-6-metoxy-1,4-benzoquinol methylase
VGCSTGYLAARLVERGHEVVGIELDPQAAQAARSRGGFEVVTGSAADAGDLARAEGTFDAIICGDVLEHLADPEHVLRALRERVAPGGVLIASLPNAAHWTARRELLRGRFPQADHGIFDRTHLRFFTRSTARELLGRSGYDVIAETPVAAPLPLESRITLPSHWRAAATRRRPGLFALQVVFTARPRNVRGPGGDHQP